MRIALLVVAAAIGIVQSAAHAQADRFPSKPIRLVLSFGAPGGAPDAIARLFGPKLTEAWGQPVVIEARTGAGGIIATEHVAKSAPDGYTYLLTSSAHAILPAMHATLPYDPIRDFTPVSLMAEVPNLLIINPSVPARSVKEFIAYARANPGKLNFGSPGSGSTTHVAGELFAKMAGVKMIHVPYKTSGALLTDLVSGQVQLSFGSSTTMASVRSGKLIALGVTGSRRVPTLPDLPTLAEAALPGYAASAWYALFAPAGTPKAVVDKLYPEIQRFFKLEEMREKFAGPLIQPIASTPQELAAFLPPEIEKWGAIVREAGIKPE